MKSTKPFLLISAFAAANPAVEVEPSYLAVPLPQTDPTTGFKLMTDPADKESSPLGWHSDGKANYTTTRGNNFNVIIQGLNGSTWQPDGGESLNFSHSFNPNEDANTDENLKAAAINAFYVLNWAHDLLYKYGYDEKAGNGQQNNFGKGGKENDAIQVFILTTWDGRAELQPDGPPGKIFLGTSPLTNPSRHAAFNNYIVLHEYFHHVAGRLTGEHRVNYALPDSKSLYEAFCEAFVMFLSRTIDSKGEEPFDPLIYIGNGTKVFNRTYSTDLNVNPDTLELYNDETKFVARRGFTEDTMFQSILYEM